MLTTKKIAAIKAPGRYADGPTMPGFYLQVTDQGAKSYILRYELNGREHMLGLGSVKVFTPKEARERARAARALLADGINPLERKRAESAARVAASAVAMTFAEASERYYAQHKGKWSNAKHAAQFVVSMKTYAYPIIGKLPIAKIDTTLVLAVLEQPVAAWHGYEAGQFWTTRPTTADRVRARIETVLDWAKVRGYRSGENPARWRGHLDQVLAAPRKLTKTEHHAAMPYVEVPAFMAALATKNGVASAALRFLILTVARTGEVTRARWTEFNLKNGVWTIPASRMKARVEHRVPLAPQVVELLSGLYREQDNNFVFLGSKAGEGISSVTMSVALRRSGYAATVHGFRSSFRDWSAEQTAFAREVAEQSLAHTIGAVERAYKRTDLFDRRRELMNAWAAYCTTPVSDAGDTVVSIRGRK